MHKKHIGKGVVAHPSTMGRSTLQGVSIIVGEMATPCCMHASRFFINTPSQLIFITKSLIECTILKIRSWVWFHWICKFNALCFDTKIKV